MNKKENKNLEQKILKRVYKFEKERTSLTVLRYIILVGGVGALIVYAVVRIYEMLYRQGTLDLLQIFGEDRSIINQYLGEVFDTFTTEFPKFLGFELLILILIFATVLILVLRNFGKIKNRLRALKKK